MSAPIEDETEDTTVYPPFDYGTLVVVPGEPNNRYPERAVPDRFYYVTYDENGPYLQNATESAGILEQQYVKDYSKLKVVRQPEAVEAAEELYLIRQDIAGREKELKLRRQQAVEKAALLSRHEARFQQHLDDAAYLLTKEDVATPEEATQIYNEAKTDRPSAEAIKIGLEVARLIKMALAAGAVEKAPTHVHNFAGYTSFNLKTVKDTANRDVIARGLSDATAARAWAQEQGIPVNSRGRVPADIVSQYLEAHS